MTAQQHLKQYWHIEIIHGTPRSYTGPNYTPCPIFTVAVTDSYSRIIVRTGTIGAENQAVVCAETLIGAIRKNGAPDFLICDLHCRFKRYINCCASRFGTILVFHSHFHPRPRTPTEMILRSRNFNRCQFSCIEQFNRKLQAAVETHNRKIEKALEKNQNS